MARLPFSLRRIGRDYPLAALGVVMAVLLVALLALPFLGRSPENVPASKMSTTGSTPS